MPVMCAMYDFTSDGRVFRSNFLMISGRFLLCLLVVQTANPPRSMPIPTIPPTIAEIRMAEFLTKTIGIWDGTTPSVVWDLSSFAWLLESVKLAVLLGDHGDSRVSLL